MFLNIHIDLLILKTYYGQFTLTTKKSLHIIFKPRITQTTPYYRMALIAQGFYLIGAKDLGEITTGSPPTGAPNRGGGRLQSTTFHQYLAVSQKRCMIGYSYYGTLIATRMRSIEWRYALFSVTWYDVTTPTAPFSTFCIHLRSEWR